MILHGRILGVSGTLSGALFGDSDGRTWRLAFLAGLVLAPVLVGFAQGQAPRFVLEAGYSLVIAGGLLVGLGARLGSGCTSGHGICGLSRLSPRSTDSVTIFMIAGMITVGVFKAAIGG